MSAILQFFKKTIKLHFSRKKITLKEVALVVDRGTGES